MAGSMCIASHGGLPTRNVWQGETELPWPAGEVYAERHGAELVVPRRWNDRRKGRGKGWLD